MSQTVSRTAADHARLNAERPSNAAQAAKHIKVLLVMPLAEQRGGGELMLLHLLEHGRNRGVDWSVVFFSDGPMVAAAQGWNIPTFIVHAGRLRQPHRMAKAILQLRHLIREHDIDLVFSWMGKAQLYGGVAAALAGVPAIWYQLGLPDPPCWQDRWATRLPARAVLTCSRSATAAQAKLKPHRPTFTVNPGVDLTRFDPTKLPSPAECRRKLGLPQTGPLIGIVGRLQRWKGLHHLVDAMPAVLKEHPDAHAVIVGGEHSFEPAYPQFLRDRIAFLGLKEQVILAGLQSNVPEWMQAMDVVVHASDAEPFGIVVIEAMALGKLLIATNTAGPSEIIQNGVNGFLWTAGDISQLAKLIVQAIQGSSGFNKNDAIQRSHNFSSEQYAENVVRAITDAIQVSAPKEYSE